MKIVKLHIVIALSILFSSIMGSNAFSAYDPSKIKEVSVSKFWAQVNSSKEILDEEEYIICGTNVCGSGQKCAVKTKVRKDMYHTSLDSCIATGGEVCSGIWMGMIINWTRGSKEVTTYEYACYDEKASPPLGYKDAPEGGYVKKRKVRTGAWLLSAKTVEESCISGNDKKQYCLLTKEKGESAKKATVSYNQEDTAFRGCEVLPVKLYNNRSCFFCSLFTITYAVSNQITSKSFKTFASAFAVLIALGLAIWIAVRTLAFVSSISRQDAPKFLTEIMKQSYKFLIAFVLLMYSGQIFNYGINPVLDAGLDFGIEMVRSASSNDNLTNAIIGTEIFQASDDELEELSPGVMNRISMIETVDGVKHYNTSLYRKLDTFVVFLQRNIAFMQSVGGSLMCIGGKSMLGKGDALGFGDGFQLVVMGGTLAGFAFLLSIAFAFYLVDAIVQIGIAGALMPFLIACWPFKITSKYAKTGWSMILNAAFVFMFAGMVVTVDLSLVSSALEYTATQDQSEKCEEGSKDCEVNLGGLYNIAVAINTQDETELEQLTDISSIGYLILLFCCVFGFQFMTKATELAGSFANGGLSSIAPGIATMGASAAKNMALKSTQSIREAASATVKSVPGKLLGAAKSVFSSKGDEVGGEEGGSTPTSGGSRGRSNVVSKGRPIVAENKTNKNAKPTISEGGSKKSGKPVISESSVKQPSDGENKGAPSGDEKTTPADNEQPTETKRVHNSKQVNSMLNRLDKAKRAGNRSNKNGGKNSSKKKRKYSTKKRKK